MTAESLSIHLVGDSTMSEKADDERPETGWGMPFADYFDGTVTIENHARNGRSTRTFREEGRWQPVVDALSPGDYVFIQFGHNDEVESKEQYTPEGEFESNLETFVSDTRERDANPVLLTPIARRHFDDDGNLKDTHRTYSERMRDVARDRDVPLIDMDARSQTLITELGREASTALFLHLEAGEHPNYPDGVTDNTHFSERGARRMAELVLDGIDALDADLAARIERDQQSPHPTSEQ